jgi:hypothetical protein
LNLQEKGIWVRMPCGTELQFIPAWSFFVLDFPEICNFVGCSGHILSQYVT